MSNMLYEVHAKAKEELVRGHQFNWSISVSFDASKLEAMEMTDVVEVAKKWRSLDVPPELYFTHRQFYKDGVEHIIRELKARPTSNRALYSLISQDDISKSGDAPIPSFMIFQCQIDGETLYCTTYFRALEVSNFLKVNLEEIRQTLLEIRQAFPRFKNVNLTVFAFHAYLDENRRPLLRPKIEVLHDDELQVQLIDGADNPVKALDHMLRELRDSTTVVSPERLQTLQRILSRDARGIKLHSSLLEKRVLLNSQLDSAIHSAKELAELRKAASRGDPVSAAISRYQASISALLSTLNA